MTIHENASDLLRQYRTGVSSLRISDGITVITCTPTGTSAAGSDRRFKQCCWCGECGGTCSRWPDRCHRCWMWF